MPLLPSRASLLLLLGTGCTGVPATFDVEPRAEGVRAPLTSTCGELDPERCLLPFPSSAFTAVDASTVTGVRVAVEPAALPTDDDPTWVNVADGFSRVSPIATAYPHPLDEATTATAVHLYVAFADGTAQAREIPMRIEVAGDEDGQERLILGYPLEILPANADMVVVVDDTLRYADGTAAVGERSAALVAGTAAPESEAEATLAAYHAPTRRLLADAGIDPAHVIRAWDFPTRSADDPGKRLRAMLEVAADPTVTVESVTPYVDNDMLVVVSGTLDGVPDFRSDHADTLTLDADSLPVVTGTRSAPFRIVVPAGTGDYRIAMYGHGTGGNGGDDNFDRDLAARGLAKVGIEFLGWNGDDLITMITYMTHFIDGSARSTSALLQTYSDAHQILLALDGALGDALSAETFTVDGVAVPNPAFGRRPSMDEPVWVGGSLGGTNGAIMVAAFPEIRYGVLNVPAGAWSHIIPDASLYRLLVEQILTAWYPETLDARLAIAMGQNAWDDVDGAAWEYGDNVLLLQESIGDAVVPNRGTVMLALAMNATLVGPPIDELVGGLPAADVVEGATGLTQFLTSATDEYDVHGFGDTDYAAGIAAREQIASFLQSVLDGAPRIEVPESCVENGSCDFSEVGR
ncbi:MAG: hypothetical protein Q8P18_33345 [Pseudomonadota bacterium]|nr:hypothetical protein [Pseudomonadota bacterium]